MEDEHRLKERVELSLDNRQIFLLFSASAVVISLVFALGVVVGKRLVGTAVTPTSPTDPLALLDQMGSSEPRDDELTFQDKLAAKKPAKDKVKPADAAVASADVAPAPPKPPAAAPVKVDDAPSPPPPAVPAKVKKALAALPPPAAEGKEKRPHPATANKNKEGPELSAGSYTLQLSSFQDRAEAERFMQKLRTGGLAPTMTPARIPNRGLWYRVRLGSYGSWEEAISAKNRFEKNQQVIAYVARK